MVTRRDMRPRIVTNALASPDLGNAERVFLIVAAMLPTEYVDGERRPGSRGMDERGKFALHYDYLARALHTSVGNAKKLTQRLEAKEWLSKVHRGTFGRPATYQALDVRGDTTSLVRDGRFVPPYELYALAVRGDTTSSLTYRTPDRPSHKRTSGDSRHLRSEVDGSNEKQASRKAAADLLACETHGWADCLDRECIEARESRSA